MPGVFSYLRSFRHLARTDESDGTLLERFRTQRDEQAFATLVQRHGPLILGIIRRLVGPGDQADDVFQATFLVLARKGQSMERWPSVAGWLVQVARRTALQAQAKSARRSRHEQQAASMTSHITNSDPARTIEQQDLATLLDAELDRLPGKYRTPIILCQLQGQTREETARQLGWPLGSVAGRLARGKKLLQDRLLKRGIVPTLTAGALTMTKLEAQVPALLVQATTLLASHVVHKTSQVPASAAITLAQGVMTSMLMTKVKYAAAALLFLCLCAGTGAWAWSGKGESAGNHVQNSPIEAKPETTLQRIQGLWVMEKVSPPQEKNETMDRLLQQYWLFKQNELETFHRENEYRRLWPMQINESVNPPSIQLEKLMGVINLKDDRMSLSFELSRGDKQKPLWCSVVLRRATDAEQQSAKSSVQPQKVEAKTNKLIDQLQGTWEVTNVTDGEGDRTIAKIGKSYWIVRDNAFVTSRFPYVHPTDVWKSFRLDDTVTPIHFDYEFQHPQEKFKEQWKGIIKLENDILTLKLVGDPRLQRPTSFTPGGGAFTFSLRRASDYDRLEGIWRKEERNPVTDELESAEEMIFKKNQYVRRVYHFGLESKEREGGKVANFLLNESASPKQIDLNIRSADEVNTGYARQLKDPNSLSIFAPTIKNNKILERQVGIYELKDNEFTYQISGAVPFMLKGDKLVPDPQSPLNRRPTAFVPGNNATEVFRSLSVTFKRMEKTLADSLNLRNAPHQEVPAGATQPNSSHDVSSQITELKQQRLKVAEERMEHWEKNLERLIKRVSATARLNNKEVDTESLGDYEGVETISQQLLEARLEVAKDNEARIKAYEAHISVLKRMEKTFELRIEKQQKQTGVRVSENYVYEIKTKDKILEIRYRRIEAMIKLEELKAKK